MEDRPDHALTSDTPDDPRTLRAERNRGVRNTLTRRLVGAGGNRQERRKLAALMTKQLKKAKG